MGCGGSSGVARPLGADALPPCAPMMMLMRPPTPPLPALVRSSSSDEVGAGCETAPMAAFLTRFFFPFTTSELPLVCSSREVES